MIEALPKPLTLRKWTIATFLGWFAGIVFILLLSGIFDAVGIEGYQFHLGLGMGGGVGITQWLVLRKFGFPTGWISTSTFGLAIPFLIFDVLFKTLSLSPGSVYLPLSVVTGGVVVSILQFRLLRTYAKVTSHWLLLSATGWCLPVLMLVSMDYIKLVIHQNLILFFYNLTMILCGGLVLGLCTGKIIVRILQTKFKEV